MNNEQEIAREGIIRDIYLLYELSLAIGQSLDLQENCERFCNALIARKNINYAAIWIKNEFLTQIENPKKSSLVYAQPEVKAEKKQITNKHEVYKLLKKETASIIKQEDEIFEKIIFEKNINSGSYAIFALENIGFLKLYVENEELFDTTFINMMFNVVRKFAVSIQGCLYHQKSIYEAEAKLRVQASLQEKDILYRSVVESLNEGLVITDTEDKILFINSRMETISGYKLEEVVGNKAYELFLEEKDWPDLESKIDTRLAGEAEQYEVQQIKKDGTKWWSQINASPHLGTNEEIIGTIGAVTDITERKQTEQNLRNSEEQIRLIIDTALDAVVIIDENGRVINWNPQAESVFGWSKKEMMGRFLGETIIPYHHRSGHRRGMERYHATGEGPVLNKRIELTALRRNGDEFPIELAIAPVEIDGKKIFSAFIRDITKQKQAAADLMEASRKAEASANAKERFLANMSHEIRTPMNAIVGMSNLLNKTSLNEKQTQYIDALKKSADSLLYIINDILDFSKIGSGKLALENIAFSLHDLLRNLVAAIQYKVDEKGIDLTFDIDPNIHKVLKGDPIRLNQILLNLVNNAIKFTNKGSVDLECKLIAQTVDVNTIEFNIADTGIGIEADKIDSIFDSFSQADESITRRFGGTGLGLAICKQLVELFGGTIKVQSQLNKGTIFSFVLNLPKGKESELANHIVEQADVAFDLEGYKVLLVEDNEMNLFLAKTILLDGKMNVDTACNGLEAVDKVMENEYDIILMDVQMPLMSGIEATQKIRTELKLNIPIIALTANAIKGDNDKCLQAGMNAYIAKPFETTTLFSEIAALLSNRKKEQAAILETPKKRKEKQDPKIVAIKVKEEAILYSTKKLAAVAKGNDDFVKHMMRKFIEQSKIGLVEIKQQYDNKNWLEVKKAAHKFKPSLDFMDVNSLKKEIRLIEKYAAEETNLDQLPDLINYLENTCHLIIAQIEKDLVE